MEQSLLIETVGWATFLCGCMAISYALHSVLCVAFIYVADRYLKEHND